MRRARVCAAALLGAGCSDVPPSYHATWGAAHSSASGSRDACGSPEHSRFARLVQRPARCHMRHAARVSACASQESESPSVMGWRARAGRQRGREPAGGAAGVGARGVVRVRGEHGARARAAGAHLQVRNGAAGPRGARCARGCSSRVCSELHDLQSLRQVKQLRAPRRLCRLPGGARPTAWLSSSRARGCGRAWRRQRAAGGTAARLALVAGTGAGRQAPPAPARAGRRAARVHRRSAARRRCPAAGCRGGDARGRSAPAPRRSGAAAGPARAGETQRPLRWWVAGGAMPGGNLELSGKPPVYCRKTVNARGPDGSQAPPAPPRLRRRLAAPADRRPCHHHASASVGRRQARHWSPARPRCCVHRRQASRECVAGVRAGAGVGCRRSGRATQCTVAGWGDDRGGCAGSGRVCRVRKGEVWGGPQVAVNAQQYAVLVMDVPNFVAQRERLLRRAARSQGAWRSWCGPAPAGAAP